MQGSGPNLKLPWSSEPKNSPVRFLDLSTGMTHEGLVGETKNAPMKQLKTREIMNESLEWGQRF